MPKGASRDELIQMTLPELENLLRERRADLFELRRQLVMQRLENNQRIKQVKREVARILTVIREKELAAEQAG